MVKSRVDGRSLVFSSSLDWATHTSQANNVVFEGKLASVVEDGSTKARFKYYDGAAWKASPWYTGLSDASSFGSWTTPSMSYDRTYDVIVQVAASAGRAWASPSMPVQVNRVPELTVLDTGAREATYLDDVRFSVLYRDGDGDAPTSIQVDVNGQLLDMHPPAGSGLDYAAGVEYHYVLSGDELGAPGVHTPTYRASDGKAYRGASAVQGGQVTVTQAAVATHTFEDDSIGGVPQGFTKSSEPLNYWRVADTGAAGMSHYVALGGHGKALWFARSPQGTYNDPGGGVPKGSVSTMEYDLSSVEAPVLSFSSYYETEDLGKSRDRKFVYVNAKDPGDSFWEIRDEPLYEVTGLEGGYKKWRSQAIDLSSYQDKVVQFEFRFDAVDNQDNSHVGWLIDDVSIGHDADGDTLPDELELHREDIAWMRHHGAVPVPDGDSATSFVRRPSRALFDHVVLEGIVRHNDLDNVDIYIGYEDTSGQFLMPALILDNGVEKSVTCAVPDSSEDGYHTEDLYPATRVSDGVFVDFDLIECGFSEESTDLDWFLRVQDDATNGKSGVIEDLRFVTTSHSMFRTADSDGDGVPDGAELSSMRDPVGHDLDRDGLFESQDPDPRTPGVAPAFKVWSNDYAQKLVFNPVSRIAPLASLTATGVYGDGSETELPLSYNPGWFGKQGWRADTSVRSDRPVQVVVHWQDVYGNLGSVPIRMASSGSYVPVGFDWRGQDAATGEFAEFSRDLAGPMAFGALLMIGAAFVPGTADDRLAMGVTLRMVAPKIAAAAIGTAIGYAVLSNQQWVEKAVLTAENAVGVDFITASGAIVTLTESDASDIQARNGVSKNAVKTALENGKRFKDLGGLVRHVHESNGVWTIVTAKGAWKMYHVVDAWQWSIPASVDYANPDVEDFLLVEQVVADVVKSKLGLTDEAWILYRYLLPLACATPQTVRISATSPVTGADEPQDGLDLPLCVLEAWVEVMAIVSNADKYLIRQGLTDAVMGQMSFGYLKEKAEVNQFFGEFSWYWDDVDVDDPDYDTYKDADCANPSTWKHDDIRRCNEYDVESPLGKFAQESFTFRRQGDRYCCLAATVWAPPGGTRTTTLEDYIAPRGVDWDYHGDVQFDDVLTTKGFVTPVQRTLAGSVSFQDYAVGWMETAVSDAALTGKDGDVRVFYNVVETAPYVVADYRRHT